MIKIAAVFLMFLLVNALPAQTKFEREYRIKPHQAPQAAKDFIRDAGLNGKVKWYAEEGLEGSSVEAKMVVGRQKLSIEFDTAGMIQDVETEISAENMDAAVLARINDHFGSVFNSHKIIKIQESYTGERDNLTAFLRDGSQRNLLTTHYEIVVKGRDASGMNLYEFLFNDRGDLISRLLIIHSNTDNLQF